MRVSVIVCTHASDRFTDLVEAVDSLIGQTYARLEIVIVVDGNPSLCERVTGMWADNPTVEVVCSEESRGVDASRNRGVEAASGDVVAFMDDDAVAHTEWVDRLVEAYEDYDAVAVGGRIVGDWLAGRPWYLPDEFDWLVGITQPGFAARGEEVRTAFESNLSVRSDVYHEVGGFVGTLHPDAEAYAHGEDADFGTRLQEATGRGIVYEPTAIVRHKVFADSTGFVSLAGRAIEAGRSRRRRKRRRGGRGSQERRVLWWLVRERVPRQLRSVVSSPSLRGVGELVAMGVFAKLLAFGYIQETLWEARPDEAERAQPSDEAT